MLKLLLGLFSGPSKAWAYGIAIAILLSVGSVAGWKARDYFAERKALKELTAKLHASEKLVSDWQRSSKDFEKRLGVQNAQAAALAEQRDEARAVAGKLAQQVQTYKRNLTKMEKPDVENGGMCERTAECHWLLLNSAYAGTAAPAQCAGDVPDEVPR